MFVWIVIVAALIWLERWTRPNQRTARAARRPFTPWWKRNPH